MVDDQKHNVADEYSQLWTRFKAGDSQAFGQLVARQYRMLYNYATKFSKDRAFIEDCLQEVFLNLWHNRENLSETSFVKAYLLTAVRNRLLKERRRPTVFQPVDDLLFEPGDAECSVEESLIMGEQQQEQLLRLRQSVLQLTPRQQEIIYLRFYQHLNHDEIAQLLHLSRPSVANLLSIALKELRKKTQWVAITMLLLLSTSLR